MPTFGKRSKENIATCHVDLQRVANHAIKHIDFTVTVGHRGKAAQDEAFAKGHSKLKWPQSKHNKTPSRAFDFIPFPFDGNWQAKALIPRFEKIGRQLEASAKEIGVDVTWGGRWRKFVDRPHLELA